HVETDATEGIDDLLEADEVEHDVVVDLDTEVVAHRVLEDLGAAALVSFALPQQLTELVGLVDPALRDASLGQRYLHPEVAGEAEHRRLLGIGMDREDDD